MVKKRFSGNIHRENQEPTYDSIFFFKQRNNVKLISKKKPNTKSKFWSLAFFAINVLVISVILVWQLNTNKGVVSLKTLANSQLDIKFLWIGFGCVLLSVLLSSLKLFIFQRKFEKRGNLLNLIKSQFVCEYYSKLTPFALGGQPSQVYYIKKTGVKTNTALSMISCGYVSQKLTYCIISIVAMVALALNNTIIEATGVKINVIISLATVSLVVLAIFLSFVILISVNKRLGNAIIVSILRFLTKIKIIKNIRKAYFKVMRPTLSFQYKMKQFFKSKKLAFSSLIISFLAYIALHSVPFFIYSAFNGFDINMYATLLLISIVIELSAGVNPLPGGAGVAETSFLIMFAGYVPSNALFWAMIFWRVISYYSYIIIGFFIVGYDMIIGNKKFKKAKLKNMNK